MAPPKVTNNEQMELKDMLPTGPNPPVEQDIMHLARLGELAAIQQLINDGNDVNFTDEEGITPLHVNKMPLL